GDARALEARLAADRIGRRPIVVADGVCPTCGDAAPLAAYLDVTERHGGIVLLDDTQALGVLGRGADRRRPFGEGGGGSLQHCGVSSPRVVLVASLAKALGVPVAVVSGARPFIERLNEMGEARVHCSPPSMADIRAGEHAIAVNEERGEA